MKKSVLMIEFKTRSILVTKPLSITPFIIGVLMILPNIGHAGFESNSLMSIIKPQVNLAGSQTNDEHFKKLCHYQKGQKNSCTEGAQPSNTSIPGVNWIKNAFSNSHEENNWNNNLKEEEPIRTETMEAPLYRTKIKALRR